MEDITGYTAGKVGSPGVTKTPEQVANEEARIIAAQDEFDAAQVIINRAAQAHEGTEPDRLQDLAREESMRYAPDLPADLVPEADVGFHPGAVAGPSIGRGLMDEGFDMAVPMVGYTSSPRPLHKETNERIAVGERTGKQSTEAQIQSLAEQEETARWLATQQEEHARNLHNSMIDERAAQLAEVERREQIIRETQEQDMRAQQAAQYLANTEPLDPGRWWKDSSAGKKAGFVIGSIFLGLLGADPTKLINTAIERDIEAQKHEFGRRKGLLDAEGERLGHKRNIWADLRANALSDDEADLQAKNAYLESFKQNIIAGLHERGVAELGPQHQQLLAQIEDQQAQNTLRWQALRAANTPTVARKQHYAIDPATGKPVAITAEAARMRSKFGTKLFDAGLKEEQSARDASRGFQADIAKQEHKAALDRPPPGTLNKDDRLDIRALRADDKYSAAVAMLGHIDRMLAIAKKHGGKAPDVYGPIGLGEDVLGVPFGKMWRSEDKEAWDLEAGTASEIMVNRLTGAVADDAQKAIAGALVGTGAQSAGERVRALETARRIMSDFIVQKEGHLTETGRQELRRNPNLPSVSSSSVIDTALQDALEDDYERDE